MSQCGNEASIIRRPWPTGGGELLRPKKTKMIPSTAIDNLDQRFGLVFLGSSRPPEDGTPVPKHVGVLNFVCILL